MGRIFRFDCFEVDAAAHQLYKHGAKIKLRDQSFQVLALLLERPGQVVTRDNLRHRLWSGEVFVDFENSLNSAVGRLRETLCDSAEHPRFIETVPRMGYRFVAPVVQSVIPDDPAVCRRITRLLVLPFVNSSGDPSQEYFSDAMTNELIAELSALAPRDLAVIARTTAMHYKGTHKDVARIARERSVDYIVEGSARRSEDRVSLTVQLIRGGDQTHAFARRYDVASPEIFDLPRQAAQAVCDQILCTSPGRPAARPAADTVAPKKPTHDLAAYNSYIKGRYHLERGDSPGSWPKARECLEDAVARDPQFALAYDGLAELWWIAGFVGQIPPKEALSIGIVHALRAVDLDGDLAEAHALLGQYRKQLAYNWPEVEREMALALALNPASPIVRVRRAVTGLMPHGRIDEAIADLEQALEVDPLAVYPRMWLAVMLWLGRKYDSAIEQGRMVLDLAPNYALGQATLGMVYRDAGLFDEAIRAHHRAIELAPGALAWLGWLGLTLAESGNEAEARALLDRLRALARNKYVPPSTLAWIHIGLGEIDEFFAWMDRAIDDRDHMIMAVKTYPFMDKIRNDPRYLALLRKMHLA